MDRSAFTMSPSDKRALAIALVAARSARIDPAVIAAYVQAGK